ncbi:MMPL family transporter [Bacillus marinisedimentorum]|uniref:MMPL family transporter n=1 Tax=Bacillus marinisedimentorum TaxID=1821260 RepID=UPI0007DF369C|nr:MMPL family transporter [Bacillus marinisedimentorum]
MKNALNAVTFFSSSKKGAKIVLISWVILVAILSMIASPAKDFAVNVSGSDLPDSAESVQAEKLLQNYFPGEEGMPALLVFNNEVGLTGDNLGQVANVSSYFRTEEKPEHVKEVIPFDELPPPARQGFVSDDKTTLVLPVILKDNLEMSEINDTVTLLEERSADMLTDDVSLKITGPAGIASDTIAIFASADLVLLFSTVALILVLLIIIYRSPLLAIIPLIVAGLVHQVVDRVLGLVGKQGWFAIETQSLSIMMILLFAALTDYALFIFSRFREELKKTNDKYAAMQEAMKHVGEPIFFSGATVLVAMLVLLATDYKPYENFAPVFSIAMAIILVAGLTLIPALFALFGRRAFWPFVPKVGDEVIKTTSFWNRVAGFVGKRPVISSGVIAAMLLIFSLNMFNLDFSFNMIKSFPEDMGSRQGFELLEEKYSKGELAPTNVVIASEDGEAIDVEKVAALRNELAGHPGVAAVTPEEINPRMPTVVSGSGEAVKLQLKFENSPYDQESLDQLVELRNSKTEVLKASGFSPDTTELVFAGETAHQADVREMNKNDTWLAVILITIFITVMLAMQTRSLIAPIYMILTILLSYSAAMGLSTFIFDKVMGIEQISYRIPLYTFVFLVALGVDYNIMLISRIKEEAMRMPIKEAVYQGLSMTGGVISSAGLILAATFGVLMTQPIMELYLFGFTVSVGILMDTFLVRGILVPAIVQLTGKWNFWPSKTVQDKKEKPQTV